MTNAKRGLFTCGYIAVAAALAVGLVPSPARADGGDAGLEEAFRAGLGEAGPGDARLVLRRAGTSLELIAEGGEGEDLELTCLLCTAAEQEARAFEIGAMMAAGGDPAGPPGSPGFPTADPRAFRDGPGAFRIPVLAGGVGLALAAAGTALLLFDGDCASPERDAAGRCAALHDLAPAGWALVGTGAAAVVAAVILWLWGDRPEVGAGHGVEGGGAP